tara:strand:+ start:78852 stop:79004 length:153 start_codon:yes stop_codon:yes gene_type:complete
MKLSTISAMFALGWFVLALAIQDINLYLFSSLWVIGTLIIMSIERLKNHD